MQQSPHVPSGRGKIILPPDGRQTRIDFFSTSKPWWHAITGWMKPGKTEERKSTQEFEDFLLSRKYSEKTCKSYLFMLKKFFDYLEENDITKMGPGVIEDYNYEFFVSGRYSRSYQLQFINALTLYFEFAENVKVNLKGLQRSGVRRIR